MSDATVHVFHLLHFKTLTKWESEMSDQAVLDVVETKDDSGERFGRLEKGLGELTSLIKEAAKTKVPEAPAIRKGESIMTSRPYSYGRMLLAVVRKNEGDMEFGNLSKVELELASKLRKESDEMCGSKGSGYSQFCAPLSSAFMPVNWKESGGEKEDGGTLDLPGYSASLVKEVQDHFQSSPILDPDEIDRYRLRKDAMVRNDHLYGGALVPLAAQGELIEVLRNSMALTRVPGVRMVPLPPQGSIRYPRQTSTTTISAYSEGQTISGSRFGTGSVTLNAKSYRGLVDVTDELLRFAGNASVEALIRQDLAEQSARVVDKDMLEGPGGTQILGLLNIPSIQTRSAYSPAANGDTIAPEDIQLMIAQMAGANAHVDRGVAVLMRPELWGLMTTARNSQGSFVFQWAYQNGDVPASIAGQPVTLSTNISNLRRKGSGTALTYILVVVPSEILVGQAGVMDFAMTDSDSTKFEQAIKTVRVISYQDCAVRHENGIGLFDQILNVRTGV